MTTLLFLAVVIFGVTLAPAVPLTASLGEGVLAVLSFSPRSGFPDPLAVVLGRAALVLFPFGAPAFRLGAATAVLAGGTVLLAARFLRLARGAAAEGPVLWALEEERRWATADTVALLLWSLAGPAWMAARGRWADAVFLSTVTLALERTWMYARSSRAFPAGLGGLAWGLALSIDPRSLLLLPLPWVLKIVEPSPRPRKAAGPGDIARGVLFAAATVVGFLLPVALMAARESATLNQTTRALNDLLRAWSAAGATDLSLPARARAALSRWDAPTFSLGAVALAAIADADSRNRRIAGVWLGAGAVAGVVPVLCPWGRPDMFHELALLLWAPAVVRGARVLFQTAAAVAIPGAFLLPLGFSFPLLVDARRAEDPEILAGDVFRSTPPGEPLGIRTPALRGAALYRQRVWGDRPDLRLETGAPAYVEGGAPSRLALGLPAGFARRLTSNATAQRASPASLSWGRIPLLLAESGLEASNPGARAAAHRALGDAFFEERVPDQAEEEYLKGLAHRPDDWELHAALGTLFLDYGETARAAAALDRATRLGATDPEVWRNSAKAEYQEGRLHRALERLDTAARRFPGNADVHIERAEILEKLDRPRDAARAWEEGAALRPDDKPLRWRLTQAWLRAEEPLKAYRAVETYLSLELSDQERRDADAFRGLLLDALNRPPDGRTGSGGDQAHQDSPDALGARGVNQ